jgi:hypothetical protein
MRQTVVLPNGLRLSGSGTLGLGLDSGCYSCWIPGYWKWVVVHRARCELVNSVLADRQWVSRRCVKRPYVSKPVFDIGYSQSSDGQWESGFRPNPA